MAGEVYAFRSGRAVPGCDAQAVGQELERIRTTRGQLRPQDVLEEAQSPDSPLHNAFEWDDSKAAKRFRLQQAGKLIVSIQVINCPHPPVQTYISVTTPDKGRDFRPAVEVLGDEELRTRALYDVKKFIESLQRRHSAFVTVVEFLERLKGQVG